MEGHPPSSDNYVARWLSCHLLGWGDGLAFPSVLGQMSLEEQDQVVLWLLWPHVVLAIRASWEVVSWARFHPWRKLIGVFPWCLQRLPVFTGLNSQGCADSMNSSYLNRSYLCGAASSLSRYLLHHLLYLPFSILQWLEVLIYIYIYIHASEPQVEAPSDPAATGLWG